MEAWIAKVSVIKFEEMHQFQYIGCVLPSIQKLVCFFVVWCKSSSWLQQKGISSDGHKENIAHGISFPTTKEWTAQRRSPSKQASHQ